MFHEPHTIEEARAYRYNCWAGNPNGRKYSEGFCAAECYDNLSHIFYQCSRKNGKGINGLYCGIHAKKLRPQNNIEPAPQPTTAPCCDGKAPHAGETGTSA